MDSFERYFRSKGFNRIAGVDEAGRGPLAGPVVASCVMLPPEFRSPLIRDSKALSPKRREEAYWEIVRISRVGVGIVSHTKIDEINILQASLLAMKQAIWALSSTPDVVFIDGPHPVAFLGPLEQVPIVDGDSKSISVAAASIIAKVTRDKIMEHYDLQFPDYGFLKHKGYPTRDHLAALKRFGPTSIHRLSFSPVFHAQNVTL